MLTQKEQFAILFLGATALFGGLVIWFTKDERAADPSVAVYASTEASATTVTRPEEPVPTELEIEESNAFLEPPRPPDIAVAVMGAVENEGLYRVQPDMRVGELIDKAGGTTEYADLGDINLGAKLIDGTTLSVPSFPIPLSDGNTLTNRVAASYAPNPPQYTRSYAVSHPVGVESGVTTPNAAPMSAESGLINLNTATQAELETLPGIGPAFAQRIIDFREHAPFTSVEQLDDVPGIGPKRLAELRPRVAVE